MVDLRGYQRKMKSDIYNAWDSGFKNVLGVLPTGGGKTSTFSDIILDRDVPSCAVAHRQELVSQISTALARNGVRHRIIGPPKVIKLCVNSHMEEMGKSFFDPNSWHAVAGVDTLVRREKELASWLPSVKLWVEDECFPAWTLVDGTPIKNIRVGDLVTAFNEKTKSFEKRRVVRLFKNPAPTRFIKVVTQSHHVLYCTQLHPFFTRRGWVNAADLKLDDEVLNYEMLYMRGRCESPVLYDDVLQKDGSGVLQSSMLEQIQGGSILANDVRDESETRVKTDERKEPYALGREPRKNESHFESYRAPAATEGREWEACDGCGADASKPVCPGGIYVTDESFNGQNGCCDGVPKALQNRLREPRAYDRDRGGRSESCFHSSERARCEERFISYWSGLDSVSILEQRDLDKLSGGAFDGYVYNIEVEGLHTYVAENVVVHNCHHVLKKNKWGRSVAMFPNALGLGVTATPIRADGKGLGSHADGVFDFLVEGPSMRELIESGYLTDYDIYAPASDYHRPNIVGASGDYTRDGMRAAVKESKIVGDVVKSYLQFASGKLGITFVSDLDTAAEVSAQFNTCGVPSAVVSSETPDEERVSLLRQFKNRQLMQLVNVDLFGEGFDLPAIEVVSFARPTESLSLYIQQFGRALRLFIDYYIMKNWESYTPAQRLRFIAESTKPRGIIIDHVGNVTRHRLPDAKRQWSLDRRQARGSADTSGQIPIWTCVKCSRPQERIYDPCKFCGAPKPLPSVRSGPEQVDGDLVKIDPEILAAMREEIEKVDMSASDYRQQLVEKHCPKAGQQANVNKHLLRQVAQEELRKSLAWWGGLQRSLGRSDSESYRRFYFEFGVDIMTAQMLGNVEAHILKSKVDEHLKDIIKY